MSARSKIVETQLVSGPLPPLELGDDRQHDGAELIFHGRVRQLEGERTIVALDYEHYEEMAAAQLQRVAEQTAERFPISAIRCWHRVGRVAVGEASLRTIIWSPHRAEALEAMAWFILALKRDVPIWKWGVDAEGNRWPS